MRRMTLLGCLLGCAGANAQQPAPATSAAGTCIELEVNGERVPDYECLGRMLAAPATRAPPTPLGSEQVAGRAPTALGLATPEATRQRMGNTFGTSTQSQRPPAAVPRPAIPLPPKP